MSGHSKWKKIKRQKGVADLKRGNLFTKLGQAISIAVREGGGGDPDMNFALRLVLDKAKDVNMPKDTIERAIQKGLGQGDSGPLESITYEVVGPDGIAILVDCMTDNKNRTITEIKKVLTKTDFSIGGGSLKWQFEEKGSIILESFEEAKEIVKGKEEICYKRIDKDETILKLMEIDGVEDVIENGQEIIVYTAKKKLQRVFGSIKDLGLKVTGVEIIKLAKNYLDIQDAQKRRILSLMEEIDENPDVTATWTNVKLQ
ncbi:YebC/PmpR family DNA-binding transcriptional regulator [Candidatus Dojkabacteria bacterium]|nr:YebC/PmpR family DNA-binding transcriptional regulator [Candidatus Dojkabacteria bacterium]